MTYGERQADKEAERKHYIRLNEAKHMHWFIDYIAYKKKESRMETFWRMVTKEIKDIDEMNND